MRLTTLFRRLLGVSDLLLTAVSFGPEGLVLSVRPRWRKPRCGQCGRRAPQEGAGRVRRWHLYVVLDIFSRYAVGWMVANRELAHLARQLIDETTTNQNIEPGQLTIHSDRGSPMVSKTLGELMVDLEITRSLNRPYVSDDNPFSEAQFKTLKYRPDFPDRFGSLQDARAHVARFFNWYDHQHRHSGIAWMTPADVHYGRAHAVREQRAAVLDTAYQLHPERFVSKRPEPAPLPSAVWINQPATEALTQ